MHAERFSADVKFPTLRVDRIPEDRVALSTILSGQLGMDEFYSQLEGNTGTDDCGFLVRMLRRDWRERFESVLEQGAELLRSLGAAETPEILPSLNSIQNIAAGCDGDEVGALAAVIGDFASRALCCHELVPWKSDTDRVFTHFRGCLEAEDGHLAVIDLLHRLV